MIECELGMYDVRVGTSDLWIVFWLGCCG